MGMTVETSIPKSVDLQILAQTRRAMLAAAEATVLPAAVLGAPYEDVAKHDVHLRDTAFARLATGQIDGVDAVLVGFSAFWAAWQEMRMDYHHTHGHAKFLEMAMIEQGDAWLEAVAAQIRESFPA